LAANLTHEMSESSLIGLSVAELRARRGRLARSLGDPEATLRGTLQRQGRRCGRPGCRCTRGELHGPYLYLALYLAGRSRSVYVSGAQADAVGELVGATTRSEATLAEISQINLELLRRRALG
jgi:hypothetical protein